MIRILAAAVALVATGCDEKSPDPTNADPSSSAIPTASAPVVVTSVSATIVPAGSYAPRDNCSIDPTGAQFRAALMAAVSARDADALLKLASPEMKLDFGGAAGTDLLRERLSEPRGQGGWEDLAALMQLGCVVYEGRMVMPSFFAREFPDPYAAMIVMGENVPLRHQPSADAAPVTMLSWQAVELKGSLEPVRAFQRVALTGGGEGYVPTATLRSVLDYRLIAEKDAREQWRITAFVAGD